MKQKGLLSKTFLANLFNFSLRLALTFILGDVLGFDYRIYYPLLLLFLIAVGYFVHAKFVFKNISYTSALKYLVHLLIFNYIDYLIFEILILNLVSLQVIATTLVALLLFIFKFLSLNYLVFTNSKKKYLEENSSKTKARLYYNKEAKIYDSHHNDKTSKLYYSKFISNKVIDDSFQNKTIMEAMCASGTQFTTDLYNLTTDLTLLDISDTFIEIASERYPDAKTINLSLDEYKSEEYKYDIVCIIGGLHEVHPNIQDFMQNVFNILKPKGKLYLMEPHKASIFNIFRSIWYKLDSNFQNYEAAIDVKKLIYENKNLFQLNKIEYSGFFGYLFILQSRHLRIPKILKTVYSPVLLFIEPIFNLFLPSFLKAFCILEFEKYE